MNNKNIQKLEGGRAAFAYDCVIVAKDALFSEDEAIASVFKNAIEDKWKPKDERLKRDARQLEILNHFVSTGELLKDKFDKSLEEAIKKFKSGKKGLADDYKSYTRKLPMLIKTNGLGAALAFIKAKGKAGSAYELLYAQIRLYLKEYDDLELFQNDKEDLVNIIINLPSNEYRFITTSLLAFLGWLKRFAEGLIDGE